MLEIKNGLIVMLDLQLESVEEIRDLLRNYLVKIFLIKVENTGGPIDDTKYHTDHFVMKDCIDMLMAQLYLKKKGS